MSAIGIEENTLGVPVGERGRNSSRRSPRVSLDHDGSLGTGFLGIGAALIVAVRVIYGFVWFITYWEVYPDPSLALGAWVLLLVACIGAVLVFRFTADRMSWWQFALFLAALAGAVGLDLAAIWELGDVGLFATASVSAGMALLLVVTMRGPIEVLVATGVLGVVLATAMAFSTEFDQSTVAQQITTLAFAVLPAVIGVHLVHGFRRVMQVELDRVLVQSTVSAPRFAVGMLASEQLARLDLAAEKLLDSVANGQVRLPLTPRTASTAASLATELRLHLIEGRRETWLYHAITESAMLGRSVTLSDPGSLAGLLDARQRDGLLSAVWLLVSDTHTPAAGRKVRLTLGPVDAETAESAETETMNIPIEMVVTGLARNRVDPAVWEALGRVGPYTDSTQDTNVHIGLDCAVERPHDLTTPANA